MTGLKVLILVGFDDMGYDKGFDGLDFGFYLILLEILRSWERLDFFSWCIDEPAIPGIKKQNTCSSFCHPHTHKTTVFIHFSVGLMTEQMFDKIRSGLFEQNIFEHTFVFYLI